MRRYSPKLAVTYSLAAAFIYAFMALLIKLSEKKIPSEMIVFFRQLVGFCIIMPILFFEVDKVSELKTERFGLYLLRAFAGLAAMFCLIYALNYLPLVDALVLSYTRPLFIPFIIYFWFGKKWTKHIWIGLIIGFAGVLFVLKPNGNVWDIATIVGLGSGMFGAIAFASVRRLTKTEFANKIFFYYVLLSLPIAAIPLILSWKQINGEMLRFLLLIGVAGTLYEMLLTRAYRHAKMFKVGSLLYATVVFGAIFDWALGFSIFDPFSLIGIVLIIAGSIITMLSPLPERRIKDE